MTDPRVPPSAEAGQPHGAESAASPFALAPGSEAAAEMVLLPRFDVELTAPDLSPWMAGNVGIPGFTSMIGTEPGPHLVIVSLMHGNELAGAIALDRLLRVGIKPLRGRLTLGFANLAAFARFDPASPTASRFLDEDLNRLWDDFVLDGPRRSLELDRAREIRPVVDAADVLFDLHSMLWPSDPLILCGATAKGRALARAVGLPSLVVSDRGHVSGRRLIDYGRFADPVFPHCGVLVEAGQHWRHETVDMTLTAIGALLRHLGMIEHHPVLPAPSVVVPQRFAEVTLPVTAATANFAFVRAFQGGEVVPHRNTLIALDGDTEIRTPHDDCLLVMPSMRPSRGHTAVRLARFCDEVRQAE